MRRISILLVTLSLLCFGDFVCFVHAAPTLRNAWGADCATVNGPGTPSGSTLNFKSGFPRIAAWYMDGVGIELSVAQPCNVYCLSKKASEPPITNKDDIVGGKKQALKGTGEEVLEMPLLESDAEYTLYLLLEKDGARGDIVKLEYKTLPNRPVVRVVDDFNHGKDGEDANGDKNGLLDYKNAQYIACTDDLHDGKTNVMAVKSTENSASFHVKPEKLSQGIRFYRVFVSSEIDPFTFSWGDYSNNPAYAYVVGKKDWGVLKMGKIKEGFEPPHTEPTDPSIPDDPGTLAEPLHPVKFIYFEGSDSKLVRIDNIEMVFPPNTLAKVGLAADYPKILQPLYYDGVKFSLKAPQGCKAYYLVDLAKNPPPRLQRCLGRSTILSFRRMRKPPCRSR